MLILPALTMAAWRAAASSFASSAAENPVVPMTWTRRAWAERAAKVTVEAGTVKSSTPSTWAKRGSGSSVMAMPTGLEAGNLADVPAERGRALGLEAAGNDAARRFGEDARQGLAHAPGGTQHGDFHVTHGQ